MIRSIRAVRSHIGKVALCALLTSGLAACGDGGSSIGSGTTAAVSHSVSIGSGTVAIRAGMSELVAPRVGVIGRNSPVNSATAKSPSSSTGTSSTASQATSGNQPVAVNSPPAKVTPPVAVNPPPATGSPPVVVNPPPVKSSPPPVASTGSVTLDWTPPTLNSDGSTLTNLAGYYVYYGSSPANLSESVKIANPGLSAYTVSNLPSGTWYFAVSAYSSAGVESARTSVISTKI